MFKYWAIRFGIQYFVFDNEDKMIEIVQRLYHQKREFLFLATADIRELTRFLRSKKPEQFRTAFLIQPK